MNWQDIVLSVGNLVFAISLLPSITSKDKPHFYTSLTTGIVLIIFGITYVTLKLYFATAVIAVTAVLWLTLAWQKNRQKQTITTDRGH